VEKTSLYLFKQGVDLTLLQRKERGAMKDVYRASTSGSTPKSAGRAHGRDRRRAVIVAMLFLSGLGALGLTVTWATSSRPSIAPRQGSSLSLAAGRVGWVVAATNGRCQQFTFDNDSAELSNVAQPCSRDDGEPARAGTARRLDAISRSFSGRD
jgi:hypothetical protein